MKLEVEESGCSFGVKTEAKVVGFLEEEYILVGNLPLNEIKLYSLLDLFPQLDEKNSFPMRKKDNNLIISRHGKRVNLNSSEIDVDDIAVAVHMDDTLILFDRVLVEKDVCLIESYFQLLYIA